MNDNEYTFRVGSQLAQAHMAKSSVSAIREH